MHSRREAWSCPRLGTYGSKSFLSGEVLSCSLTVTMMASISVALKRPEINTLGIVLQQDPIITEASSQHILSAQSLFVGQTSIQKPLQMGGSQSYRPLALRLALLPGWAACGGCKWVITGSSCHQTGCHPGCPGSGNLAPHPGIH